MKYLIPLIVFLTVAAFLFVGLGRDPSELPSALIEKTAPSFELPQLTGGAASFNSAELHGQIWVLNIWASWCGPCREEHPFITRLANETNIAVVGLNYKDQQENAKRWLQQFGNPFSVTVEDSAGRAGMDWGVYGVPETFIIDKKGMVRLKHVGPVTEADLEKTLLPLIQKLQDSPA